MNDTNEYATGQDLIETIKLAIQIGEHQYRTRLIDTLEKLLDEMPHGTLGEIIPIFLNELRQIPAPQTLIDMEKAIMKSGMTRDEYQVYLEKEVRKKHG